MTRSINTILESRALWFLARLMLIVIFISSGLAKLIDFDGGIAEMRAAGLEPPVVYNILSVIVLLSGTVLILADRLVWLAAVLLTGFMAGTILVVHTFWRETAEGQMISLYFAFEHITVIGGLIITAVCSHLRRQWLTLKNQ